MAQRAWLALPLLASVLLAAAPLCHGAAAGSLAHARQASEAGAGWLASVQQQLEHMWPALRGHLQPRALPAGPVCLDGAGRPVDWWLDLKQAGSGSWAHVDSASQAFDEALGHDHTFEGRFRCGLLHACARVGERTPRRSSPRSPHSHTKVDEAAPSCALTEADAGSTASDTAKTARAGLPCCLAPCCPGCHAALPAFIIP